MNPSTKQRVIGLCNLALAEDTNIELFVQEIGDGEVAVWSCEVTQNYRLPSKFEAERVS
jgi:hypothetical protein